MDLFYGLKLSTTSLLFFSLYPFVYFGYQGAYWYRPDLLKRLDILYITVAVLLALLLGMKLVNQPEFRQRDMMQLGLLHLSPLLLAVLIAAQSTPLKRLQARAIREKQAETGSSGGEKYDPVPLNAEVEAVGWDDLVIDDHLRDELISVISLLKDPSTAKEYGISIPKGILLYGPPGTGKTTIAKVIARTAGLSFFALKLDEIVSKWVGESEKNLTVLFQAAKRYGPSIIFIDEIDSIGKSRGMGGQSWADNLLNHLLQLVDGVVKQEGLYIIAATNRPELVDSALRRAGRLEKTIEIPLPDFDARYHLFQIGLSKLRLDGAVDLDLLSQLTEGKSGADIKAICNQAGLNAFKRESASGAKKRDFLVTRADLEAAMHEFLS